MRASDALICTHLPVARPICAPMGSLRSVVSFIERAPTEQPSHTHQQHQTRPNTKHPRKHIFLTRNIKQTTSHCVSATLNSTAGLRGPNLETACSAGRSVRAGSARCRAQAFHHRPLASRIRTTTSTRITSQSIPSLQTRVRTQTTTTTTTTTPHPTMT